MAKNTSFSNVEITHDVNNICTNHSIIYIVGYLNI
jgi:hypothetical protein